MSTADDYTHALGCVRRATGEGGEMAVMAAFNVAMAYGRGFNDGHQFPTGPFNPSCPPYVDVAPFAASFALHKAERLLGDTDEPMPSLDAHWVAYMAEHEAAA